MTRIALVFVALIAVALPACKNRQDYTQHYPNLTGEVLFDNDQMVVQRFVIQPGQWEGIHSHSGSQLYVHLKGGEWTVRSGDKEEVSVAKDGSVGWQKAVDLSEKHESGNTGTTPIEWLWITLKQ
jgi:mannose-6-phosphate isomerase-like protein (cupin superfamily)